MKQKTTGQLLAVLQDTHSQKELQDYCRQHTWNQQQLSFSKAFLELLEEHQLSKADVIRKSMLDRTYAYQITGGIRRPSRDKIIALGIAAEVSLKEVQHLLICAKEGALYPRCLRDAILIYGIEHHQNILQINELLEDAGEKLLF